MILLQREVKVKLRQWQTHTASRHHSHCYSYLPLARAVRLKYNPAYRIQLLAQRKESGLKSFTEALEIL